MEKVGAGLAQATGELIRSMSQQTEKVVKAAENMTASFNTQIEQTRAAGQAGPVTPERADVEFEGISVDTQLAAAEQPTPENSVVQLLEAKTAYTASLKALDVVNDMQRESVNILK